MSRTLGKSHDCNGCRFWSEMIARSVGVGVQAMCMGVGSPHVGNYTSGSQTCDAWKSGHLGAIDDPPDYGEQVREAYGLEDCDAAVVYLDEEAAERAFHASGMKEFIFFGWHVHHPRAPWGRRYSGPYDTEEQAGRVLAGSVYG